MGWNLDLSCRCGFNIKTLKHIFCDCPDLSSGRHAFFSFLASKIFNFDPDIFNFLDLAFSPNLELINEMARFLQSGNIIL